MVCEVLESGMAVVMFVLPLLYEVPSRCSVEDARDVVCEV